MDEERIAKYEAWVVRLEKNLEDMGRQRSTFRPMAIGVLVASAVGFFWGWWVGVGTFATGVMVVFATSYITMIRTREYREELEKTRAELAKLKARAT